MTYSGALLLDTNILVHYVRQDNLMRYLEEERALLSAPDVWISVITEGELRSLALRWNWGAVLVARLDPLFLAREWINPASRPS